MSSVQRFSFGYRNVAALVLALSLSSPVIAQTAGPASSAADAGALSHIRIDNFGQIDAAYYRGSQPEGHDYADLAAIGVKTVIDLQADGDNQDEADLVKKAGMTFYRIPMTTRVAPTSDEIATFLHIVNDPAQQPVYVHCAGGRHRTGVMTAVYRMERDHWTAEKAFAEMKQFKFGVDAFHPEFKKFVYGYHVAPATITPPVAVVAAQQ